MGFYYSKDRKKESQIENNNIIKKYNENPRIKRNINN